MITIPVRPSTIAHAKDITMMIVIILENILKPLSKPFGIFHNPIARSMESKAAGTMLINVNNTGMPAIIAPIKVPKGMDIIPIIMPFAKKVLSFSSTILKDTGIEKTIVQPSMDASKIPERTTMS